MKRLIACCDGTWNTPDQEDQGVPAPTNVFKIHAALEKIDKNRVEQISFYRQGVGTTGGPIRRLIGGGIGVGLKDDIKSTYKFLCENYSDGFEVFLFGFSRGAFAARSLTGMLNRCGLLDYREAGLKEAEKWDLIEKTYQAYRDKDDSWRKSNRVFDGFKVKFLGVWDTVGSLGIPDDMAFNMFDRPENFTFHDTQPSDIVKVGRHAMAIDERRQTFVPTRWTGFKANRDFQELWFPGVHGDVGGSYADHNLGDIALKWMIEEAEKSGLGVKPKAKARLKGDPSGILHNSFKGIFARLKTRPRSVPMLVRGTASVHDSVFERQDNPPLSEVDYWPTTSLEPFETAHRRIRARSKWHRTHIYLREGETYAFEASGEWLDSRVKSGPEGRSRWASVAYLVATIPEFYERMRRRSEDGLIEQYPLTRRVDRVNWFALVGAIGNGRVTSTSGVSGIEAELTHEMFGIGSGRTYSPKKDGYLYCFANDAWRFYGNNKGSMALSVKRLE